MICFHGSLGSIKCGYHLCSLQHVSYQISQLKEEISNYQNNILTLNLEIEKLSKEKQELKMEIRNKTSVLNNIRNELKDTKKENDHLYKTLSVIGKDI